MWVHFSMPSNQQVPGNLKSEELSSLKLFAPQNGGKTIFPFGARRFLLQVHANCLYTTHPLFHWKKLLAAQGHKPLGPKLRKTYSGAYIFLSRTWRKQHFKKSSEKSLNRLRLVPPRRGACYFDDLDDVWLMALVFFFQGNKKCWKRVTLWSPQKPSYTRSFLDRFLERKRFGKRRHPSLKEPRCHHG